VTAGGALRQCPRCGWWTHVLEPSGACLSCTLGWVHCAAHTCRLEWAGPGHRKVTAWQVVATMRERAETGLDLVKSGSERPRAVGAAGARPEPTKEVRA